MIDNSKRTGAAVEAHYQFLIWLMPTVEKFPKNKKFTMGDRIQNVARLGQAPAFAKIKQVCCGAFGR